MIYELTQESVVVLLQEEALHIEAKATAALRASVDDLMVTVLLFHGLV